jgi:hypothetical protein
VVSTTNPYGRILDFLDKKSENIKDNLSQDPVRLWRKLSLHRVADTSLEGTPIVATSSTHCSHHIATVSS